MLSFTDSGLGYVPFICGVGLLLGIRHATDADHIVALSTVVSQQRSVKRAAMIGSVWGVGHTITIFAVGSAIILLNVRIPARLGLSMEFCVALMLVVLGLLNLTGMTQRISGIFARTEKHKGSLLGPIPEEPDPHTAGQIRSSRSGYLRPLLIGLVHGLAGSAAVALLVLSTIRSPLWATLYLLIFGLGTIVGMVLMTTAIALPLSYGTKRFGQLNGYLTTLSGIVSLCFGLFLVYELGYVGGLFSRHPHWVPA